MANVLVVAPRYDEQTTTTSSWAARVAVELRTAHQVRELVGSDVTSTAFSAEISTADFVLFYGHGESDRLTGQGGPGVLAPTLVDVAGVQVFRDRLVYTVCCHALAGLGVAYAAVNPNGTFVGYKDTFALPVAGIERFEDVVNQAAIDWVNGKPGPQVLDQLRAAWHRLSDEFLDGYLRAYHDFFIAAYAAKKNGNSVGSQP